MSLRTLARAAALGLITFVVMLSFATPVAAHGRGTESTNFRSRITAAPEIPGVTWSIYGGDQYLAVHNTTDTEVIVEGYEGEPYARIGPEGVLVNLASEATYVNEDRYAQVAVPAEVGRDFEPRWDTVFEEPTFAWHDHRIHWMSAQLPPAVTDPSERVTVPMGTEESGEWSVPFTHGDDTYEVRGVLEWVPPPSPVPWLGLALVLTLPALLGLRNASSGPPSVQTATSDSTGVQRWVRSVVSPAAVVLGAVSLLNLTHLVDDLVAVPLPLTSVLVSAVQTTLFIALGVFGAVVAYRGRDGAFTALGVGSLGILVGQGLLYVDVLRYSQSASVFPAWSAMLIVALSLMQALPVGTVAFIGNRRLAAVAVEEEPVAAEVHHPGA